MSICISLHLNEISKKTCKTQNRNLRPAKFHKAEKMKYFSQGNLGGFSLDV